MIRIVKKIASQFKEYIVFVVLVIVSLSFLAANENPRVKNVRSVAFGTFAVVNETVSSVISLFKKDFSSEELKKENARLMLEVNRLRNLQIENERLSALLGLRDTSFYPLLPAKVVSKLVNKAEGNFIINRGFKDSLKTGMPVITDKGLVGIITDLSENFSVVRTIQNSSLNIAVTIQGINVDGILSWNGYELVIKNIPTTYNVRVGDRVETSDFSTLFPPKIPVGVVSKKESISLGLLHTISVQSFVQIPSVQELFVLKVVPSRQVNNLEMNLMK